MTIKKPRGMEFDTVILPGLERRPPPPAKPLMRWTLRQGTMNAGDSVRLLLAPIREAGQKGEAIGDHLARLDADEEDAERARLLYVAATRAISRLHVLAVVAVDADGADLVLRPPEARSL